MRGGRAFLRERGWSLLPGLSLTPVLDLLARLVPVGLLGLAGYLIAAAPDGTGATVGETQVVVTAVVRLATPVLVALAIVALLLTPVGRRADAVSVYVPAMVGLSLAALAVQAPVAAVLFLACAGCFVPLCFRTRAGAEGARAGARYLAVTLMGTFCLAAGLQVVERVRLEPDEQLAARLALVLLLLGFASRLGALPLHVWLPSLVEQLPARCVGAAVASLFLPAIWLLATLPARYPRLLDDPRLPGLALAAALLAALTLLAMAGAGREPVALVAWSLVAGSTLAVFGALAGGAAPVGALWLVAADALGATLTLAALGELRHAAERQGRWLGIARRLPVSTAGAAVGALSLAGVPGLASFPGRWLIYGAVGRYGPVPLVLLVLAGGAVALAILRVLDRARRPEAERPEQTASSRPETGLAERPLAVVAIVALSLALLGLGLYPAPALEAIVAAMPHR